MHVFRSGGWHCQMRMFLVIVVLLSGTVVRAQTATTTTLAVSPSTSPLAPQTVVALTATVTAGGTAVHPGMVRFCDATAPHCTGLAILGTAQLTSAGTAVLRFIPGGGSHSYQAVFAGTTTYAASISPTQTVTVSFPLSFPTTSSISSSGFTGNYTLTGTVVSTGSLTLAQTGSVSFVDTTAGNAVLGTATLGAATPGQSFTNAPGSPFAVGNNPIFTAVGDFNGDGIADLAVSNSSDNTVSILLGNGSGGFALAPGSPITVGTSPFGLAVGDFNDDGIADLAVANSLSNTVSILLGNGSGGFTLAPGSPVAVGSIPYGVAVGDFNDDGIADLAVAIQGANTINVLLGNGSGGFVPAPGSPFVVGTAPYSVTVGDFNGDGVEDLAVPNTLSDDVSILLGNGSGGFVPAPDSPIAVGTSPRYIVADDFNGDGIADLAVSNSGPNTVSILVGNGHGGFTNAPGSPVGVGPGPKVVTAGDFNGDGIVDLAVSIFDSNNVTILLGNGNAGFAPAPWSPVAVGSGPRGVVVGDFNGDGMPDIADVNFTSNTVSILLNQVTQTATAVQTGASISGGGTHLVNATYLGDANFEGSISPTIPLTGEIEIRLPAAPTITTLAVSPSSPVAPQTAVTLTATVTSLIDATHIHPGLVTFCDAIAPPCTGLTTVGTAQLTSAGAATLRLIPGIGSHNYIAVFAGTTVNTGSASLPHAITVSSPSGRATTTTITATGSAGNYTLTSTAEGTGSFTLAPTGSVSFVDTSNSNHVLGTATLGAATLRQSFVTAPGSPDPVGTNPYAVAVGDFNGDGITDLAVADNASHSVVILLGNGDGSFTAEPSIAVGTAPTFVVVGDFNGDGNADLAVANFGSNSVSILLGNGHGSFTVSPITVGVEPVSLAVGDFNGDGNADLAVANEGSTFVSILLGHGDGTFAAGSPVEMGSQPYGVVVGKFNTFGFADLAVTDYFNHAVNIFLGNGDGTFTTGPPIPVGNFPRQLVVGDFNGDGIADLAVPNDASNDVSILLGHGDGTFAVGPSITVGTNPTFVAVGDFNGNGIADLAVSNSGADNDVSILLGDGHGGFAAAPGSPVEVGSFPLQLAVGDFTGNGLADFAVTNSGSTNVSVFLNEVTQTATAVLTGVSVPGASGTTHQVHAAYPGDTNFGASTSPNTPLTASPVTTTTTLELSTADTIAFGTPVILTANVTPHVSGSLTATGTVSFHDGATLLGTEPISSTGEASITVSTFGVGAHSLTAVYAGDEHFLTSTGGPVSLIVIPAPIAVSLISSDNPSDYGQAVTFTATVPSAATGTIQFRDGTANLGTPVTLVGGIAAYTTGSLTAGAHPITAVYSGDGSHAPMTSDVLTQQVNSQPTATSLAVSPSSTPDSPLAPQTMVTLTATVTVSTTPVFPGLVTFCDATAPHCIGLAILGTAQLTSAGLAVLRFIPGSGTHSYVAVFAGTTGNTTSSSTPQSVTISPPTTFPSTNAITSSGSTGNYTLTATVVGTGNATQGPTGGVPFIDTTNGNSVLGTATLGTATLGRGFVNGPGSPIAVGNLPVDAVVGDFNGDGIPDLAVANSEDNTVTILLGNGSGGFVPAPGSPVTVGGGPYGVVVGDFNGDGHADLAVANTNDNTVSILLGNGSGGFSASGSAVAVGTHPFLVAVGDFNGDGFADLAVTNFTSNNVSILLGDGHGGFTQPSGSPIAVGGGPYGVAVGDFNEDGITDLAVTNQRDNNVTLLLGDGSGGFSPSPGPPVAVGTFPVAVAVGDFDGSGHADLAVASVTAGTVSILLGDGHGGFTQPTGSPITVGSFPNSVVVGDFNGDGIADLAVPNFESNTVSILLGNGSGGFSSAPGSPLTVGDGPYAVAVGDFNGDGLADLAIPNYFSDKLSILLNQVTQTATAVLPSVSVPGSGTHNVEASYPGDTNFVGSTSPTIPLTGSPVTTATTLVLSTANTIPFGTPVTLTANVTPYTASSLTATGTMTFFDGATSLGTAPITSTGEASITVSTFTVAGSPHSLTAVYSGDPNFITSTGGPVLLTVNPAPIAVSLISSDNPSGYGQTVTFTATVPSGATGTVQFKDGAANLGAPVTLGGGVAAFTTSALMQGTHPITAAYSGDTSHLAATSDVLLQLVTHAILTVTASNITRPFSQPNGPLNYTITGFIGSDTAANSTTGTPSVLSTATVDSPVTSYPIVISQGTLASTNYIFIFVNGSLTVAKATPGTGGTLPVTVTSSTNPSYRAESVIFTATLPPNATGQVTFMDGSTALGTVTVLGEVASFSTSALLIGTHSITAVYSGDSNFNGVTSAVLAQMVNKTTLQVIANDAQRLFGQPNPVFTTTLSGFVGGDTAAVVTGAPNVTTTATPTSPVGVYPIVATQGTLAAANYIFAFLNGNLTITQATPGGGGTPPVTVAPSANPAPAGSPVTFTVTVPAGATGTVSFYDGTTLLGTAPVTGNTASLTVSTLGVGTHTISAVYSGDANFATVTTKLSQVIAPAPDFTVASSTGRQLIPPGASASFAIAVSSMNAPFTNPVTMSATNLPPGATYTFTPAAVTPGAAGANTTFTVSVPPQNHMASRSRSLGPVAFALLLLPFAWLKRYRKNPHRLLLWILVALVSFGAVSGCGEGGYFSQTEQTYTITVTGTSGSAVRNTTVTLTVE